MMYRINEIFYSLQGEGYWTGTPIVFVRFSGCNLKCPFCDTSHEAAKEMEAQELLTSIQTVGGSCRCICLTGGEPSLQADQALLDILHEAGYKVHVETNGTRRLPEGIDWITLSPKSGTLGLRGDGTVVLKRADEIKLVLSAGIDPTIWEDFPAGWHFLQPCSCQNTAEAIDYVLAHPSWRLSIQTHKYTGIR